jgi:hypothetical protein
MVGKYSSYNSKNKQWNEIEFEVFFCHLQKLTFCATLTESEIQSTPAVTPGKYLLNASLYAPATT